MPKPKPDAEQVERDEDNATTEKGAPERKAQPPQSPPPPKQDKGKAKA